MAVEVAADHGLGLGPGVEIIRGGMDADEALAGANIGEKRLPGGRVGELETGRVLEDNRIVACEAGGGEVRHVLAEVRGVRAGARADHAERLVGIGDRRMDEALRAEEHEDPPGLEGSGPRLLGSGPVDGRDFLGAQGLEDMPGLRLHPEGSQGAEGQKGDDESGAEGAHGVGRHQTGSCQGER